MSATIRTFIGSVVISLAAACTSVPGTVPKNLEVSAGGWIAEFLECHPNQDDTLSFDSAITEEQAFNEVVASGDAASMHHFVSCMWTTSEEMDQIIADMFGPSSVSFHLSDKSTCVIDEVTRYPFEDSIEFNFSFDCRGKHQLVFSFCIPGWAEGVNVRLNGQIIPYRIDEFGMGHLSRRFRTGDTVTLIFDSEVQVHDDPGLYATRGNVRFVLPDGGEASFAKVAGEYEYYLKNVDAYPFDSDNVPAVIRVPVTYEKKYAADELGVPVDVIEIVELVPYGCTKGNVSTPPLQAF